MGHKKNKKLILERPRGEKVIIPADNERALSTLRPLQGDQRNPGASGVLLIDEPVGDSSWHS